MKRVLPCAVVGLSLCGSGAPMAQSADEDVPEMPAYCTVQDASEFIRIAVCEDPSYGEEEFVAAGRAACGERLPCGTWIWRDAENAPEKAPDNHDGLTQAQITSAQAVWVAEKGSLISIADIKNSE